MCVSVVLCAGGAVGGGAVVGGGGGGADFKVNGLTRVQRLGFPVEDLHNGLWIYALLVLASIRTSMDCCRVPVISQMTTLQVMALSTRAYLL